MASLLLGAADSANMAYRSVASWYPRQHAWILHAGDTWRVNDNLTLDYGLRWDYFSPSSKKSDRLSFFDPAGPNPGAGGHAGPARLRGRRVRRRQLRPAVSGEGLVGGFAPRLGAVYSLNDKTVLRGGWGIFYTQAFYPGWGGGMSAHGFSNNASIQFFARRDSTRPVPEPRDFRLATSTRRRTSNRTTFNGQDHPSVPLRPIDANARPYSHQWNVTVDRELGRQLALSIAYVGSAGRRLPSNIEPLNAIDPSYLRSVTG